MTIRKGEAWGVAAPLPDGGVVVRSDHEAATVVAAARAAGAAVPTLGLLGGDLCRTLGGTGDLSRLGSDRAMTFVCDVGIASLDGVEHPFVAHAIARRGWWRGRAAVTMNSAWVGAWNLGPKAHPGDGLLDITDIDVSWTQWREVRKRLPTGAHLPHPQLRTSRTGTRQWRFERPTPVYLDGSRRGRARELIVRVEADAVTVVV